jgi:hypothetical protein
MLMRLLDWLCDRWLRRYEGDLPVVVRMKGTAVDSAPAAAGAVGAPTNASPDKYSPTPLADALSKPLVLPDVPKQTVTVTGEWQQQTGDYGVGVEADVDIGKPGGWSTGGKGGYWKDKGAAVMGWFQWKGKR